LSITTFDVGEIKCNIGACTSYTGASTSDTVWNEEPIGPAELLKEFKFGRMANDLDPWTSLFENKPLDQASAVALT
jgi:hypothetical protein